MYHLSIVTTDNLHESIYSGCLSVEYIMFHKKQLEYEHSNIVANATSN
jgi:hypothetical protein